MPDSSINSSLWSGSVLQPGTYLQGIEVIKQRIYIVLSTPLGSDPLRPLFGTDIFKYTDKGTNVAAAGIKSEIIYAINTWVPEIALKNVSYAISSGAIAFTITYSINGTVQSDVLTVGKNVFSFSGIQGTIICDSALPVNTNVYGVDFLINNAPVSPQPSGGSLTSVQDVFNYAKTNWSGYGTWGLGKDVIVCYVKNTFLSGSLNVYKVS